MQPSTHRSGRKRRHYFRNDRPYVFIGFLIVVIVGLVGLLFWMMTSMRFAVSP